MTAAQPVTPAYTIRDATAAERAALHERLVAAQPATPYAVWSEFDEEIALFADRGQADRFAAWLTEHVADPDAVNPFEVRLHDERDMQHSARTDHVLYHFLLADMMTVERDGTPVATSWTAMHPLVAMLRRPPAAGSPAAQRALPPVAVSALLMLCAVAGRVADGQHAGTAVAGHRQRRPACRARCRRARR